MGHGDVTHVDIPADDVPRAAAFYSAVLGWDVRTIEGFEDFPDWSTRSGATHGTFGPRDDLLRVPRSYVEVASIDDVLAAVVAAGGTVVIERQPLSEVKAWAVVTDTEGNQLGLYEGPTST